MNASKPLTQSHLPSSARIFGVTLCTVGLLSNMVHVPSLYAQSARAPRSDAGASTPDASAPTGPATTLRMHFTQGQRVRYNVQTANQMSGISSTINQTMELETTAVQPDGNADQRLRVTRVEVNAPGLPTNVRQQMSQQLTGITFQYRMSPRGQIVSRQPVQGLPPALAQMGDQLAQSIEQLTPQLPEAAVAIGHTWRDSKTTRVSMGASNMTLRIDLTYTLRELRRGPTGAIAVVGVALAMSIPQGTAAQNVTVTGTGTGTGDITLQLDRGVVQRSHSTAEMQMQIRARGQQPQSVRTQTTSDMTLAN